MKKQSKVESLVQIDHNSIATKIVTRLLTNSLYEASKFLYVYKNHKTELESNYDKEYKYCISVVIQQDIATDLII